MALLKPLGHLEIPEPKAGQGVVKVKIYREVGAAPTYASPVYDAGLVTRVDLPLPGLPAVESPDVRYGAVFVDGFGHESNMTTVIVAIDSTPPDAPATLVYVPAA